MPSTAAGAPWNVDIMPGRSLQQTKKHAACCRSIQEHTTALEDILSAPSFLLLDARLPGEGRCRRVMEHVLQPTEGAGGSSAHVTGPKERLDASGICPGSRNPATRRPATGPPPPLHGKPLELPKRSVEPTASAPASSLQRLQRL